MVERAEVYIVADGLVAERELVSVRSVRRGLAGGGAFDDILPHLAEWKRERNYHPPLARLDLSDDLAKALAHVVTAMRSACAGAGREAPDDGQAMREPEAVADRLAAIADGLQETADRLAADREREEVVAAPGAPDRPGPARAGRRPDGRPGTVEEITARAFWDAVMREVEVVLAQGPLGAEEIRDRLSAETVAYAARLGYPLTPGDIAAKMRVRITHGRYFADAPDGGRFMRRGRARGAARAAPGA